MPAHTIEFVLNFQLFGFSKSINQAFLTKRPVRVFGIVAKYCNCESPWLFFLFVLALGFRNCSLLALM